MTADRRYHKLDGLRGLTLLSMIGFHAMWDLVYLFGVRAPWYGQFPGFLWQQSICWTFILLSGFCWPMGRRHLARGLTVFLAGALVTAVTYFLMPESVIFFGVLTLIGSGMLLLIPLDKLFRRVPARAGLAAAFLLFLFTRWTDRGFLGWQRVFTLPLPSGLYRNYLTAWLGFPFRGFYSTDYFPLLPWIFLYLSGYFLCRAVMGDKEKGQSGTKLQQFLRKPFLLPLEWLGRHSLLLYLLHQPVIYLVLLIFHNYGEAF